jgi:RNA ligase (TIGR02306 family)
MTDRKLATVRKITALNPISGADRIEVATVDGWQVVCQKGLYVVGDYCVYCEIDSWIPTDIAPFLSNEKEPKEYLGVKGERLRTIKLKKQISQGLLLPLSAFPEIEVYDSFYIGEIASLLVIINECELADNDLTLHLGIIKWERSLHPSLAGTARGNFPSFIPKTDEERVQNLDRTLEGYLDEEFEATIKLDGSSTTMYFLPEGNKYLKEGEVERFGVCSRNLDLTETDGNAFWQIARELDVENKLRSLGIGEAFAIQGELVGPSIQGNYENVTKLEFYVYKIFDIDNQVQVSTAERRALCKILGLKQVPILDTLWKFYGTDNVVKQVLDYAEGPGMNLGVKREGVVFKHTKSSFSFKGISNSYLLAER